MLRAILGLALLSSMLVSGGCYFEVRDDHGYRHHHSTEVRVVTHAPYHGHGGYHRDRDCR